MQPKTGVPGLPVGDILPAVHAPMNSCRPGHGDNEWDSGSHPANGRVHAPDCCTVFGTPTAVAPPDPRRSVERIAEMARDHELDEFRMRPSQWHRGAGRPAGEQ